jgi:hypothetical protein
MLYFNKSKLIVALGIVLMRSRRTIINSFMGDCMIKPRNLVEQN